MLCANGGNIYIDDFTVECVTYPLDSPKITYVSFIDINKIEVKWSPVDGATSYYVYVQDPEDNSILDEQTVTGTSAYLRFIPIDHKNTTYTLLQRMVKTKASLLYGGTA